jgi:uncharacterized protein YjbJ (UPF0337 family)
MPAPVTRLALLFGEITDELGPIKGNWKQLTGQLKAKWGKLTDDDWTTIAGKRDELLDKPQETYGYSKDRAEKEVDNFIRTLNQP